MIKLLNAKNKIHKVILGKEKLNLERFIAVARYEAKVEFDNEYINRVSKSRLIVEKWTSQNKIAYGVNTCFGALCNKTISEDETKELQKRIIASHATALGQPLSIECVRGIILMILQNLGLGYSGTTLATLNAYKNLLNEKVTPYVPKEGSVGYLSTEAYIALAATGEGKAYNNGSLMSAEAALNKSGLKPIELSSKEGLSLLSGTTSVTALGAIALYDFLSSSLNADIISAMSFEILKGNIKQFDKRLMSVRTHIDQQLTANNLRRILNNSKRIDNYKEYRLQDALSLRCIPQLHGASKKTLKDALITIEEEMNSCTDNPTIWPFDGGDIISGGNCDSSYVGMEIDSASIAATCLAKMSERRNNRLIDSNYSELPSFLTKKPGLNSGLMLTQYTQAGILNEMKLLSAPTVIDNIPTCAGQEDYVGMGYNSSKKALNISEKLNYILAIELLSVFQANYIENDYNNLCSMSKLTISSLNNFINPIEDDIILNKYIEDIALFLKETNLLELAQENKTVLEL